MPRISSHTVSPCPVDDSLINWSVLSSSEQTDIAKTMVRLFSLVGNTPSTYEELVPYMSMLKNFSTYGEMHRKSQREKIYPKDKHNDLRRFKAGWNTLARTERIPCHAQGEDGCDLTVSHRVCETGPRMKKRFWINQQVANQLFHVAAPTTSLDDKIKEFDSFFPSWNNTFSDTNNFDQDWINLPTPDLPLYFDNGFDSIFFDQTMMDLNVNCI